MSNAAKFEVPGSGDDGKAYTYNEGGDAFALTDLAASYQPLDSDLTAIAALTTTPFGRGLLALANAAALRTAADVDQAGTAASLVAAHEADTTSVHGIADTSVLATDSDVSSAVSTHAAATDPHGDRAYTDSAVSALSTVYQPLDSDLTAIAALTTTSTGRSLLAAADAAAIRTIAGAEVSGAAASAVSAHDADTSVHGIADTSALLDTSDIGVSVQGYSSVLAATTASFTTADETKLDGIEALADVTDETNVVAALSGATLTDVGTPASGDKILLLDASDSDNLKVAQFSTFGGGGGSDGSSGQTVAYTRTGGYYTTIGGNYASFASSSHGAGDTRFAPFELATASAVTFDRIGIDIVSGTAGAVARLGIFNVGTDGRPGTVVLDAGTVAADSAGQKEITISLSLSPGRYYIAAAAQVATTNFRAYGTGLVRANWHGYSSAANVANKDKHTLVATGITGAFSATPTVSDGDVHPVVWLRAQ